MSCQSLLRIGLGAPGAPQMSHCQQPGHVLAVSLAVSLAEKRGREKDQHPWLCPWLPSQPRVGSEQILDVAGPGSFARS